MRGDRIGQLAGLVDLVERNQHLGRNLLVELDVLLELADHRSSEGVEVLVGVLDVLHPLDFGLEEVVVLGVPDDPRPVAAFDQNLHGAVRQIEQLQHGADGADGVDVPRSRVVLAGVLLGDQQDLLVVLHDPLEGPDRLLAPHEERHDHVRKNDDVSQRENR